jgi:hypothetical protein
MCTNRVPSVKGTPAVFAIVTEPGHQFKLRELRLMLAMQPMQHQDASKSRCPAQEAASSFAPFSSRSLPTVAASLQGRGIFMFSTSFSQTFQNTVVNSWTSRCFAASRGEAVVTCFGIALLYCCTSFPSPLCASITFDFSKADVPAYSSDIPPVSHPLLDQRFSRVCLPPHLQSHAFISGLRSSYIGSRCPALSNRYTK